ADVRAAGHPVLINFFASWCVPCAVEAPQLAALSKQGVAFWGIAYKDRADATRDFLERNGNPYRRLAADDSGQTAINFGLFGVPETYFVDRAGIIRWRWAGPITDDTIAHELAPLRATYG
ncbi:redoxin domain-containing protein, partial [Acidisphaera rubrifaciens]|uniref:redoxin domain-containing protein n=1 Tax=Acidisphaera rubrifaciens TaxID=50715 RepID=UPI000662970C